MLNELLDAAGAQPASRLVTGISVEAATPDLMRDGRITVVRHADRTGHSRLWKEDFEFAIDQGFTLFRTGINWNLVQTGRNDYEWRETDELIEFAAKRGIELVYSLNHYGWQCENGWMQRLYGGRHPAEHPMLPELFGEYALRFMDRYGSLVPGTIPVIIPSIELCTDLHHRTEVECGGCDPFANQTRSFWAPHHTAETGIAARELMRRNLLCAWNTAANEIRRAGGRVMICEFASALEDTALHLRIDPERDVVGMDYYTHSFAHVDGNGTADTGSTLLAHLRTWDAAFSRLYGGRRPLIMVPEYLIPESYDAERFRLDYGCRPAGECRNRVRDLDYLERDASAARSEGIRLAAVFCYGVGGFWHDRLSGDTTGEPCNRNAVLCDLDYENGSYARKPVPELIDRYRRLSSGI